jgi:hypothetical protein
MSRAGITGTEVATSWVFSYVRVTEWVSKNKPYHPMAGVRWYVYYKIISLATQVTSEELIFD